LADEATCSSPTTKLGLGSLKATRKSGNERLHDNGKDIGCDLLDFWQWSVSDLVSNSTRGVLAEFIVARALGIPDTGARDEWSEFDLETPDKVKIQVKSAAYVQSWAQKRLSTICFNVKASRGWDPERGMQRDALRHADVYVFALLAVTDKEKVDPLDVSQWEFFAVPTRFLNERKRSQHSITLASLQAAFERVRFCELARAVAVAADRIACDGGGE
jgi:hypothetical protein